MSAHRRAVSIVIAYTLFAETVNSVIYHFSSPDLWILLQYPVLCTRI